MSGIERARTASNVTIADAAGLLASTEVESAIQEVIEKNQFSWSGNTHVTLRDILYNDDWSPLTAAGAATKFGIVAHDTNSYILFLVENGGGDTETAVGRFILVLPPFFDVTVKDLQFRFRAWAEGLLDSDSGTIDLECYFITNYDMDVSGELCETSAISLSGTAADCDFRISIVDDAVPANAVLMCKVTMSVTEVGSDSTPQGKLVGLTVTEIANT